MIKRYQTLESSNAQTQVINTQNKKDEGQAPLEDLYNFFKTCNEQVSNAEEDGDNIEFTSNETNEILQAIRSLKTNKAPGLDGIVIGHWLDMVYLPPRGNFEDYIFLEAQCLASILQHVSPLTMAALSCNSLLHTLPHKILEN